MRRTLVLGEAGETLAVALAERAHGERGARQQRLDLREQLARARQRGRARQQQRAPSRLQQRQRLLRALRLCASTTRSLLGRLCSSARGA